MAVCLAVAVIVLNGPDPYMTGVPLVAAFSYLLRIPANQDWVNKRLNSDQYRALPPAPAAALQAALRHHGIRKVHLLATSRTRFPSRAHRVGHTATVILRDDLLSKPEVAEFALAHEGAHQARYDTVLREMLMFTLLVCWISVAWSWPLALFALPLIIVAYEAAVWTSELSCDQIAARWVGPDATRRFFDWLIWRQEQIKPSLGKQVFLMLMHPPVGRRITAVERALPAQPPASVPRS